MLNHDSPFYLPPDELKELGYRIVDLMVEHNSLLPEKRVCRIGDWENLSRRIRVPFEDEGTDARGLLEVLTGEVFSNAMLSNHPRFMGFIPSPSNPISPFIEALVAAHNPFLGAWHEASGPTMVELNVLDWIASKIGYDSGFGGQLTSGGTAAALVGLAAARDQKLEGFPLHEGCIYISTQTHSTIKQNLALLGHRPEQIRQVETDRTGRLKTEFLRELITADRARGLRPYCCVATAGTTDTGAVDPLSELAEICRKEDLWFHVDAAFGGGALLTAEGKRLLEGIERADTVVVDPHKWFFQPFELGCIIARDASLLKDTFETDGDYTKDLDGEVNLSDYGLQLSRSFKALKLWFSLRLYGEKAFRQAVERGLEMARLLESGLRARGAWEIVTPAHLGIVTFRRRHLDDEGHRKLIKACWDSGTLVVSSTILGSRVTIRACPIHPSVTEEVLEQVLEDLEGIARSVGG